MTNSHTLKYPVEIVIQDRSKYTVQSIDYPTCQSTCKTLIEATNSVRDQLEDITWENSSKNKLISPSSLTKVKLRNRNSLLSEIEIVKRYSSVPKTLYYYLEFSGIAIKMLTDPYIWFSNPKSFNDPFELPDVFDSSWNVDEEWADFKFSYEHHKNKLEVLKNFSDVNEAYLILKCKRPDILKEVLELKISAFNETLNKTGVACFSRYYDNILMWSHYARKHTGIVIGYDYYKLKNENKNLPGSDVDYRHHPKKLRTGSYAGDIKDFIRSEYLTRKLFNKHPAWAYEQEYRLINAEGDGKYPIKKNYISELYFGCNIDKDIKEALISITDNLDLKYYDMEKLESSELIRKEYKKPTK